LPRTRTGALVLAGCTGGTSSPNAVGQPSAPSDPSIVDPDRGSIVGQVYNDEQLPVPGARVELQGSTRFTVTNVNGTFRFTHLNPGRYVVEVRLGENDPATVEAMVRAGETTEVQLTVALQKPLENVPYHVTAILRGHMGCNVAGQACPSYPSPNEKTRFDLHFEGQPAAFLNELVWQRFGPGPPPCPVGPPASSYCIQDTGQPGWVHRLYMESRVDNSGRTVNGGPPYLRGSFPLPPSSPAESPGFVVVKSFPVGFLTVPGYAYEQSFDLYITTQYLRDRSADLCLAPPEYCPR
jgi:hypothetical protein